ncbi:LysR family transcriptional regulator [Nocardia arthritidis]|nr:LysR family transcriptional regulator [Nocardia arthritidis]
MPEQALLASSAITLRQFDYFVSAVRLGSMSAAAKRFGVTPSAMSHSIGALENSLGHKLFSPDSRRSSLTKFGREFFTQASNVVDSAHGAMVMGQTFNESVLTIGTSPTIARKLMPPIIGRMRHTRNFGTIDVRTFANGYQLSSALGHGSIDVALGPLDKTPGQAHVFGFEELVVACRSDLRNRLDGSWQQLARLPWIGYGTSSEIAGILAQESGRAGVEIRYAVLAPDVATVLSLVEHGIGVAVVPRMALLGCSPQLSYISPTPTITRKLALHTKDMSPHVERFVKLLTDLELRKKLSAAGLFEI